MPGRQTGKIKDERLAGLQRIIEDLEQNIVAVAEVLALKPTVEQLQDALERKRAKSPSR